MEITNYHTDKFASQRSWHNIQLQSQLNFPLHRSNLLHSSPNVQYQSPHHRPPEVPFLQSLYSVSLSPRLPPPSQTEELTTPVFPALLDLSLSLSAHKIKAKSLRRHFAFARLIIGILAQRIELGILSPKNGIGFPFTDKEERKVPCHLTYQ